MSINKLFIAFLSFSYFISFSQNDSIKEIYIKFDSGSICKAEDNGDKFIDFNNQYRDGAFYICGKCFRIKPNKTIKLISKESINSSISSVKDMMKKCHKKGMKYVFNPNQLFSKIYILDDYDGNANYYLLYEVEVVYYNP